jgi:DtxR family transcriptional regulator, Mn-dependent transcriptional regulator
MTIIPPKDKLSPAVEDYLKAIYAMQERGTTVCTGALGTQLGGLKPGSVTGMLKKLAAQGLIVHTLYHGVQLTAQGTQRALAVLRHRRLLECYLVEVLQYGWDEVHAEADRLEHYISPKLAARIAARLGDPTADPHGDPIPNVNGQLPPCGGVPLATIQADGQAMVVRVGDQSEERLRYLASLGLTPGTLLIVLAVAPFDGPLTLGIAEQRVYLDHALAQTILVRLLTAAESR